MLVQKGRYQCSMVAQIKRAANSSKISKINKFNYLLRLIITQLRLRFTWKNHQNRKVNKKGGNLHLLLFSPENVNCQV